MLRLRLASVLLLLLAAAPGLRAQGTGAAVVVKDASGAVVPNARVAILTAQGSTVASGTTNVQGRFDVPALPHGSYLVEVEARGFSPRREAFAVSRTGASLEVFLSPASLAEEVTITASPGVVQGVDTAAQQVNVISQDEIAQRAKQVIAQAAYEEPGITLQRTSPTIAGIYVRGLTGNKVNVFVDGVRFTHAGQRGGISTFLDLNDPSLMQGIEVLRGPSSAQYGSDALGGSVQFLTRTPALAGEGPRFRGTWSVSGGTADRSLGSALSASWSGTSLAVSGTLTGRHIGNLRPGGGTDSHNAVTRFFGLDSSLVIDDRLPDTAFRQYGGNLKTTWAPSSTSQVTLSYTRGQQDGGKRYDQLLGGDGNLIADLRNLMLDFAYLKFEKRQAGPFDQVTLGYSFNSQREERVNQGGNGNPRASVNHEYERTTVHGAQVSGVRRAGHHAFGLGGDVYVEGVNAPSFSFNPVTSAISLRRGRVPDEARYISGGVYVQDALEASRRLTIVGSVRLSHFAYESKASESPVVGGKPLWPDDSLDVSDLGFRVGAVLRAAEGLTFAASLSRGFRAPHVTDLATLGLTGDGFEVAAPDVAGLGGTLGSSADARAVDTGIPARQLDPETSLNWEASLRWRNQRIDTDLALFRNDIAGNITKQALILPQGAVGIALGDQLITAQDPGGVVYVPAASNPVLVRANYDDARLWGVEHTLRVKLASCWSFSSVVTYLHAEDGRTGAPPNIEGGTPAPDGWFTVRFEPELGRRFWVEAYLHAALKQDRLSSLDLSDRRTGASRSRNGIANFFNNGARARGLVGPGPDGLPGTADDVLLASGETLSQIQARVLGSAGSAPLFSEVAGYAVFGVRAGVRFGGRHELFVDAENLGDRNYRGISWGVDAPGRGLYARYTLRF